VGSANIDWRSFLHNDEVTAVILGESFANEMENMFQAD
jgi:cardiolipin synthase